MKIIYSHVSFGWKFQIPPPESWSRRYLSYIESRWKIQVTIMSFGLKVWYNNSVNKMYDIIIFFFKSLKFDLYVIKKKKKFLCMPTDL